MLQGLGIRRLSEPDPEANKAIIRRLVEEVWNRTNLDAAEELFAAGFSRHGQVLGPAGVKALLARLSAALPDLHYTIADLLADGDKVIVRYSSRGTYTGAPFEHPVFGHVTPPAGLVTTRNAANIFRLVDGKAAEVWEYGDMADLTRLGQQLGVFPAPSQTPAER
jgi:predicted ester cyclase